jgi:hypothetical protein
MISSYIVLKSALTLVAIWVFIFYFWRDYRIDSFREHVFSLRNRMFLYVAENSIGFDNPAYLILRNRMNVVLRYAHEFTMARFLFFIAFRPVAVSNTQMQMWERALEAVPSDRHRAKFQEFRLILAVATFQLIVYRPFFLYLITRPLVEVAKSVLHIDYRKLLQRRPEVASSVEHLEAEAVEDARREDCEAVGIA